MMHSMFLATSTAEAGEVVGTVLGSLFFIGTLIGIPFTFCYSLYKYKKSKGTGWLIGASISGMILLPVIIALIADSLSNKDEQNRDAVVKSKIQDVFLPEIDQIDSISKKSIKAQSYTTSDKRWILTPSHKWSSTDVGNEEASLQLSNGRVWSMMGDMIDNSQSVEPPVYL